MKPGVDNMNSGGKIFKLNGSILNDVRKGEEMLHLQRLFFFFVQ